MAEEEGQTRKASPKARKNGRAGKENGRKRQERHETDKEKVVLCRVGSELSLVPASLCHSMKQEEDLVWKIGDGVIHWDIRYRQNTVVRLFFILPYASQVASLAKSRSFPQLGRRYRNVFSGEKLPQGIFCPKTGGLNVEGIVPPSYLLQGT